MIEARASKSFTEEREAVSRSGGAPSCSDVHHNASTRQAGYAFSIWLNLVCLDAPLVAISWQWLFARSFDLPLPFAAVSALFLTAWLIYLADRFGDSFWLRNVGPSSLRQRFCARHRTAWLVSLCVITAADLLVIGTQLDARTLRIGAATAACALAYLALNRGWPSLWRAFPLKEISIGFLFAAGTMAGLAHGLTSSVLLGWLLFGLLCFLNCVSIAVWEQELDAAQQRVSIATEFPWVSRYLLSALLLLAIAGLALTVCASNGKAIYLCVAVSSFFLALVHFLGGKIDPDTRTALADIVLLSPVILMLVR